MKNILNVDSKFKKKIKKHSNSALVEFCQNRPLLVVSNREPFKIKKTNDGYILGKTIGGVVSALNPILRKVNGTWITWSEQLKIDKNDMHETINTVTSYPQIGVPLSKDEIKHYYQGFSNSQLWPLFHSFLEKFYPDSKNWDFYKEVNQNFAHKIKKTIGSKNLIWIHDYHFFLVPSFLRALNVKNKIGFSLHIPFPTVESFMLLSQHRNILKGILGADLIGFQTLPDLNRFLDCVIQILGNDVQIEKNTIRSGNHRCTVMTSPVGIDFHQFNRPSN